MNNDTVFRRIAAMSAIISVPLSLGASFALLSTLDFDAGIVDNPVDLLMFDPPIGGSFQIIEFIGMFGYYLLLLPLVFYLHNWLKARNERFMPLCTLGGLGYIIVGSLGSVVLFSALPPLFDTYPQAPAEDQMAIAAAFEALFDLAVSGFFALSFILGSIWWIGLGLILHASHRFLGIFSIVLGIGLLIDAIGTGLQVEADAVMSALEAFTFLTQIWVLWMGIVVLRGPGQNESPNLASS